MVYNFDKVTDRSGSNDLKHSVLERRYGRADLLPLWVADMDFPTPPFVINALKNRLEQHPILGYTIVPDEWASAIQDWIFAHHQWRIEREWLKFVPGVVTGIGLVINALLADDERVIIQPPVYHPFRITAVGNDREVVLNPLREVRDGDGALANYEMDLDGLETLAKDPKNRLLIMSNPHNPAGIVWPRETLRRVAEICAANGVIVISDEIHCDLALTGYKHVPFASVSADAARISITLGAPTKTFNMAGLISSYAIVPDAALRTRLYRWITANELDEPSIFATIAATAAFREGEEWRQQMLGYIEANIDFMVKYIGQYIPKIRVFRPQASFLVWLDCRALGLNHKQLLDLFINRAQLALNDGEMFGRGGEGFMRINVGTPRVILQEALERLANAVAELG